MFCRVRPLLTGENASEEAKTISYPTSLEALGRGIDLMQNGIMTKSSLNNKKKKETHLMFFYGQDKSIVSHLTRFLCLMHHKKIFL